MATWAVRPSPLDGLAVTLQRWGGHRQAGTPVRAPLLILAAMVAGCASEVRIQPRATGRPEVAAYQLHGPSLEALAQELFGVPVKTLNRLQASGLIEELLARYGKSKKNGGNANGRSTSNYRRAGRE